MAKKQVIRIGDRVKVMRSLIVKRVGYPLVWTDLTSEVEKDPRTLAAYELLTRPVSALLKRSKRDSPGHDIFQAEQLEAVTQKTELFFEASPAKLPFDLVRAIARMRVEEMGFGGRERKLIYYKTLKADEACSRELITLADDTHVPDYTDRVFEVYGKQVVKTGTYYPPARRPSGSYWDPEETDEPGGLADCKTHVLLQTSAGWIEQANVELFKRADL